MQIKNTSQNHGPTGLIRVSILTTSFPRFEGDSAGTFVYKFARELNRSAGCSVRVVAPHDSAVDPSWCEFPVHHFRYFFPETLQTLAYGSGLVSRIKKNRFRILQIPFLLLSFFLSALRTARQSQILHAYWTLAGIVALAAGSITKTPVVINLWGSDILLTRIPGLWFLLARLLNRADAIICESKHFSDQLIAKGISKDRITILPNGIDLELFDSIDKTAARKQLGLPVDRPVLLTVGLLSARKGHKYLLAALPEILKKNGNLEVVIVGEGEVRHDLESTIAKLNLQDRVTLAGFQKVETIPTWLNAADIFVLPSLLEGTPNTLLEAMACGLPIIATSVGGIAEVITHGENGLLIPPESSADLARSVISLLKDPAQCERLGKNARETLCSRYGSWEKQAELLKTLYNRVLSNRSGNCK
ncbi:MAG: glycosyltransferase family 4 protein [Nitrospinae bacterium]|nr:glycosyltransferase family 4 protein [Nitrospinota bacterium]